MEEGGGDSGDQWTFSGISPSPIFQSEDIAYDLIVCEMLIDIICDNIYFIPTNNIYDRHFYGFFSSF